jgi:hypothetical protein
LSIEAISNKFEIVLLRKTQCMLKQLSPTPSI